MAAIAPDGTSWARELKAFARDIESRTQGRVKMKWYWAAIAGDEDQVLDRIRRDQLDVLAGSISCTKLAPSLRVTRVLGLFQNRDESEYVIGQLRGLLDGEFRAHGFVGFTSGLGNEILFTRTPIRSISDLRKSHPFLWSLDDLMIAQITALGVRPVLAHISEAAQTYEEGRSDGFIAVPTAALAFQWSARSKYFTDLPLALLPACLLISNRAIDAFPLGDQHAIRDAAAKLVSRFDDLNRTQDRKLLDELFEKQGLQRVPTSPTFRSEFFAASNAVRATIPESMVTHALLAKVLGWLADFRGSR